MDHQRFSRVLVAFASRLVTDYDVGDVLYQLCDATSEVLPISGAGVMLADPDDHLRFVSASDDVVRAIEGLQVELGEGPCLHAFRTGEQVVVTNLEDTDRFPRFAPLAVKAGMRAVYSFPMRVGAQRLGALNLYCVEPGEFGEDDAVAGQVLADIATTTILNARAFEESTRLASQLQHALDSRVVIEQAKGKLPERLGVTPAEAFERLRRQARATGERLHAVAEAVLAGRLRIGADDEPPPGGSAAVAGRDRRDVGGAPPPGGSGVDGGEDRP